MEYGIGLDRLARNLDALLAVLARMHDEDDKRIVIRRVAAPKTTPGEGDCSSEVQHRRAELPGRAAQPDRTGRSVAVRGFVENLYPGPQPLFQNKVSWETGSKSSRFRRNAVLAWRAGGARSGTG